MELKQACGSAKNAPEFDDLHVALFVAGASCISLWSWRDIIAFDSPNMEHGRRRWRLPKFKMAGAQAVNRK